MPSLPRSSPLRMDPAGRHGAIDAARHPALTEMRFEVFDRIADAAAAWRDLQTRAATITPFQRLEWNEALVETFGLERNAGLRIVVGRDGDRPVVIVPLMLSRRLGVRQLAWLGSFRADYNGPLLDQSFIAHLNPEALAALLAACFEAAGPADLLWLEKQPEHAILTVIAGYRVARHFYRAHALTLQPTWQSTYEKLFSKTTRRRLAEKERKLARNGGISFRRLSGRSEIEAATRDLIGWKWAQLRSHGQISPFDSRDHGFFVRLATDTPLAHVYRLSAGERTVAVCFTLVHDRTLSIYQMAYDAEAAAASPGQILLNKVIEQAIGDGCELIDFTIGDEPYKLKICDRSSDVVRAWAGLTPVGTVAGQVLHLTELARDFTAGHPTLRPLAQNARRTLYHWLDAGRRRRAARASPLMPAQGDAP